MRTLGPAGLILGNVKPKYVTPKLPRTARSVESKDQKRTRGPEEQDKMEEKVPSQTGNFASPDTQKGHGGQEGPAPVRSVESNDQKRTRGREEQDKMKEKVPSQTGNFASLCTKKKQIYHQNVSQWLAEMPSDTESVTSSWSKDLPDNFSSNRKQLNNSNNKIHKQGATIMSVSTCESDKNSMTHQINFSTSENVGCTTCSQITTDDSGIWDIESECEYVSSLTACEYDSRKQASNSNNKKHKQGATKMSVSPCESGKNSTTHQINLSTSENVGCSTYSQITTDGRGEESDKQARKQPNQQELQHEPVKGKCSIWNVLAVAPFLVSAVIYIFSKGHAENNHLLRLMLVGKTGAGKSASGNTILGEEHFRVEASPASVTGQCEIRNKIVHGRNITVIDTPGVMDTWLISNQSAQNAPDCIFRPAYGPHVFVLVIRLGRFTEEERNVVKWIQENFGVEAMKFTLILFTGGDLLQRKSVDKFISNSFELQNLVDTFEGRYHVFNNNKKGSSAQVTDFLKIIDLMLYGSMGYQHAKEVYQKAERKMKKEEEKKQIILEKEIKMQEARKRAEMENLIRQEEEVKRIQISTKMKEAEIRNINNKEEAERQEEEMKMKQMEEEMKAEKQRKVNEMIIQLRDEQYENSKLKGELEQQHKYFWLFLLSLVINLIFIIHVAEKNPIKNQSKFIQAQIKQQSSTNEAKKSMND